MQDENEKWMALALEEARKAYRKGEIPVGAVVVGPEGLISRAHNLRESLTTPLGHAEVLAIHRAAKKRKSWRLDDCTLYVTLEPCVMCAGVLVQSRMGRVVFGAQDEKAGAITSHLCLTNQKFLNHQVPFSSGVLQAECSEILKEFFADLRDNKKEDAIDRHVATCIVFHEGKVLGIRTVDPLSKKEQCFYPGGKIEDSETPEAAAIRETYEETGYRIKILADSHFYREYHFVWNGQNYRRRAEFFVALLDQKWHPPTRQDDASYNLGPVWIDQTDMEKIFNAHPAILMATQKAKKFWLKYKNKK